MTVRFIVLAALGTWVTHGKTTNNVSLVSAPVDVGRLPCT